MPAPRRRQTRSKSKRLPAASSKRAGTPSKPQLTAQLQQLRARVRAEKLLKRRESNANRALAKFRPRKTDRNTLVFIGSNGGRDAAKKESKGYLVYITKTGAKELVKQYDKTLRKRVIPRALRLRDVEPFDAGNKRAAKKFVTYTKEVFKQSFSTYSAGQIRKGNNFDSTSNLVDRLSGEIKSALESRRSRRTFQVTIKCLVEDRKGRSHVIETTCKISRQDHIAIKKAGVRNFVTKKIYAFLSQELAQRDLVSEGSARHIRQLKVNKGKSKKKWIDKQGFIWEGGDRETVKIKRTDYKIESIKI